MWLLTLHANRGDAGPAIASIHPGSVVIHDNNLTEDRTYWWHLRIDRNDPFSTRLSVNGTELDRDIESPKSIYFKWTTGFSAGFVDVELNGVSPRPEPVRVVVDPANSKLTRSDFRTMVRDILVDTKSLATTAGFTTPVGRGNIDLPIAKIEFLLENVRQTRRLIETLEISHRARIHQEFVRADVQKATRITAADWNRNRKSARPVSEHSKSSMAPSVRRVIAASGGLLPPHIVQRRGRQTVVIREHREILGLLLEMRRALGTVISNQALAPEKSRDRVLVQRATKARKQLNLISKSPLLERLSPLYGAWSPSHLYSSVEPYRALYKLQKDFRAGISSVGGDNLSVSLQETFRLYETWVAVKFAAAAKILDPLLDVSEVFADRLNANSLTFSLEATSIVFLGHRMRFKPVYSESWMPGGPIGSSSRTMIPDIVLELPATGERLPRVVVLDAKYRVDSQINDAISSIHIYRDALIQGANEQSDNRVVRGGLVVVPRSAYLTNSAVDWRTEKAPKVLFRREFQDIYKLGALTLRPGISTREAASCLRGIMELFAEA